MFTSFIVGIVVAAAAATVSAVDSIITDYNNIKDAERDMEYLDAKKKNEIEEAKLRFEQAKEEAEKNADRKDAQADLSDRQQDVVEGGLSAEYNAAVEDIQDQELKDTYDWNYYAMEAGKNEGQAQAELAGSGVRTGSSMQQALDLESAVNSQQLQLTQDITRRQQDNQLGSMGYGLKSGMMNIESNRVQADWNRQDATFLRQSYEEGGSNWNLYQNHLQGIEDTWKYNRDKAEKRRANSYGWNMFLHAHNASLSAGASGWQTGTSIGKSIEEYGSRPDYKVN